MDKLNVTIVVIDDDRRIQDDAFLDEVKDAFVEVKFFDDSNAGLDYIESNIDQKMIVLLDLGFAHNMPDGHIVLERIRSLSSLIPVIIWSGRDEDKETFADLIENKAFAFIKKSSSSDELMKVVRGAYDFMQTDINNIIETWITEHPQEAMEKPFLTSSDGKSYTLNEVLREIRLQTPMGVDVAKSINKLTIDLLMRNKEKLQ